MIACCTYWRVELTVARVPRTHRSLPTVVCLASVRFLSHPFLSTPGSSQACQLSRQCTGHHLHPPVPSKEAVLLRLLLGQHPGQKMRNIIHDQGIVPVAHPVQRFPGEYPLRRETIG